MKIFKLPHGTNVIVEWDGVTLFQDSNIIPLRWEDWNKMTKSVEEIRKHHYSKKKNECLRVYLSYDKNLSRLEAELDN